MASNELKAQRLQGFYEAVKKMRKNQEAFFSAPKNHPMKKGYLEESRKLEKQVDQKIKLMEYETTVEKK